MLFSVLLSSALGKEIPDLIVSVPALICAETLGPSACVSACYLSVIMNCWVNTVAFTAVGPISLKSYTILHRSRARRLIMPFQILLRPGQQIRRRPAFTLNNWDYPASPSDVTARGNTLKTSESARRLTSRQRNIQLKHRLCGFESMLKGTVQHFCKIGTPSLKKKLLINKHKTQINNAKMADYKLIRQHFFHVIFMLFFFMFCWSAQKSLTKTATAAGIGT